jgi:DtxR family transcriptional regulator, Mn-dependent transcriptional regulator
MLPAGIEVDTMKRICEEIMEAIWVAEENDQNSLAYVQGLSHAPFSEKHLEQLTAQHWIRIDDGKIYLTEEGREEARVIVRRHRLAETLLFTVLNLDTEKREQIACEMEHTLLPEMTDSICTLLGHPQFSPDGEVIPPGICCKSRKNHVEPVMINLTELMPGEKGRISYIKPKNHARLHRLAAFGITPGIVVVLHQKNPSYCIQYEETELALEKDVAEDIYVTKINNGK